MCNGVKEGCETTCGDIASIVNDIGILFLTAALYYFVIKDKDPLIISAAIAGTILTFCVICRFGKRCHDCYYKCRVRYILWKYPDNHVIVSRFDDEEEEENDERV